MPSKTLEERFWSKVDRRGPDECWPWKAGRTVGYGRFFNGMRDVAAHRFAYELVIGPIPEGLILDHLCHDHSCPIPGFDCPHRACCNPSHLRPATHRENVLRGEGPSAKEARQTHCIRGHPFDEENTYLTPAGWRQCRICKRRRKMASYYGVKVDELFPGEPQ